MEFGHKTAKRAKFFNNFADYKKSKKSKKPFFGAIRADGLYPGAIESWREQGLILQTPC